MGRAPCCDKASVKRGPWSPEEDAKLKAYIEEQGTGGNWIALPHKIGLKRCGKSCRLRWLNYLRPNIKHGGFSEDEDELICRLYASIGSRWSIIAAQLPGRTDNDIKNYWNTRLKKKLLGKRPQPSRRLIQNSEINTESNKPAASLGSTSSQAISTSALERMQLLMQLQGLNNPFSYLDINPLAWQNPYTLQNKTNYPMQGFEHEILNSNSTTSIEESLDSANLIGLQSPMLASDGVSADNSSSSFSSSVAGFQSTFCELLYGNNSCNNTQEGNFPEPDNLKEINQDDSISWWPNGLDEYASPFTCDNGVNYQPDMMLLQDYGLSGYGL
ncbi:hypothetical protein LUZ63_007141 [Rhynchospora breviuscula]|uniref:Uncharacterized protein n=1 Tax=Rhynchospora breviuscula TaxID=2022672 RepID=A0A9Q0CSB7_9POAL|nr:hypothetical protein LUZ63_007141 [Rhynchospora breviuscula]